LKNRSTDDSATTFVVCERGNAYLDLPIPEACNNMIIHHPDRLHESVTDGRADEGESALLQVFTQRI
jgi:hypothetical protein